MVEQKIARLRQQAEHCRRLALGIGDEETIATLLKMAQEYDEKADQFNGVAPPAYSHSIVPGGFDV
jgi:hypothetical protein